MAESNTTATRPELISEILGHISKFPNAGDTALGIWQFWLKKTTHEKCELELLINVLNELEAEKKLQSRKIISGELFYYSSGQE